MDFYCLHVGMQIGTFVNEQDNDKLQHSQPEVDFCYLYMQQQTLMKICGVVLPSETAAISQKLMKLEINETQVGMIHIEFKDLPGGTLFQVGMIFEGIPDMVWGYVYLGGYVFD